MTNHYHRLIETPDANRTCQLFQGRYEASLVDGDRYLLELARYVVLSPVRERVVSDRQRVRGSRCGGRGRACDEWL